ncbi:VOC family protein [Kribbella sp. CA-293567]|uniref:VOC family protein n=1 Tax=Kribbella sp. CA-293567 TaxID=3002436 RepID=UPI0022DE6DDC|nr:VOC family protein [Kribbella sp. CA-293567]WBQ03336.1 VOC family protein [Kribbella sp. CA-293567]
MDELTIAVTSITITTPDPRGLAAFYSRLLRLPVTTEDGPRPGNPPTDGWAQIRNATGPTLNFEYEAEWAAPEWPSRAGAQHATQHLDIHVNDLAAAVEHALTAGATLADFQPQDDVRVLHDPSGHPFCLFT